MLEQCYRRLPHNLYNKFDSKYEVTERLEEKPLRVVLYILRSINILRIMQGFIEGFYLFCFFWNLQMSCNVMAWHNSKTGGKKLKEATSSN